jgi:ketosteroid isomerase-like protein
VGRLVHVVDGRAMRVRKAIADEEHFLRRLVAPLRAGKVADDRLDEPEAAPAQIDLTSNRVLDHPVAQLRPVQRVVVQVADELRPGILGHQAMGVPRVRDLGMGRDDVVLEPSLFAEDATWRNAAQQQDLKGRDEIVAYLVDEGSTSFAQHSFTNPVIDVDGDTASATWLLWVAVNAGGTVGEVFQCEDLTYERRADGWVIKSIDLHSARWSPVSCHRDSAAASRPARRSEAAACSGAREHAARDTHELLQVQDVLVELFR